MVRRLEGRPGLPAGKTAGRPAEGFLHQGNDRRDLRRVWGRQIIRVRHLVRGESRLSESANKFGKAATKGHERRAIDFNKNHHVRAQQMQCWKQPLEDKPFCALDVNLDQARCAKRWQADNFWQRFALHFVSTVEADAVATPGKMVVWPRLLELCRKTVTAPRSAVAATAVTSTLCAPLRTRFCRRRRPIEGDASMACTLPSGPTSLLASNACTPTLAPTSITTWPGRNARR